MQKSNGFSLIELIIVVGIISILASVCFPLYKQHLVHERRTEAKITLEKIALIFEQYHLMHDTYKEATIETLGFPNTIADNSYQLNILSADDTDFVIEAQPLGTQAENDPGCASLLLNAASEKTITGTSGSDYCWGKSSV